MAYNIVEIDTNTLTPNRAIGVKFPFNAPGVFQKTFTTFEICQISRWGTYYYAWHVSTTRRIN